MQIEDIGLGVATGAWEQSALLKLNSIGLDIKGVSFSNSNYFKSREEITKAVIKQLEYKTDNKPEQIIYFGDGLWDFQTCQNLNIKFIGIDVEKNNKLQKAGAKTVFNNYLDSAAVMKSLDLI